MKVIKIFTILLVLSNVFVSAQDKMPSYDRDLPKWVRDVGARKIPNPDKIFSANAFGANGDGVTDSTEAIQAAIDEASKAGGIVEFRKGTYLTGAIFVKSNVHLKIGESVTLLATHDESKYPRKPTRIAGIEMTWLSAMINVENASNVRISGNGTIDGNGQKWWDKYWALRKEYEPKGLRWASDYDAERVRLMLVQNSKDVTIQDVKMKRSGFWTVQLLYSEQITVDGIKISDNGGPSTDGIDVDSSRYVLIQNCDIDNNDDDICLKAGRDFDGLRVNRPTEFVFIRDNIIRRGAGIISIGSETSGGIRNVVALNNEGMGTTNAVRLKSAKTRGGYIRDILIRGLELENVTNVFAFTLNWNPSYSYASIPAEITTYPDYWKVMTSQVLPIERGYCEISNIRIENVNAIGSKKLFTAEGLPDKLIQNISFENIDISGNDAGTIDFAKDWTMKNVRIKTDSGENVKVSNSQNVGMPSVSKK